MKICIRMRNVCSPTENITDANWALYAADRIRMHVNAPTEINVGQKTTFELVLFLRLNHYNGKTKYELHFMFLCPYQSAKLTFKFL